MNPSTYNHQQQQSVFRPLPLIKSSTIAGGHILPNWWVQMVAQGLTLKSPLDAAPPNDQPQFLHNALDLPAFPFSEPFAPSSSLTSKRIGTGARNEDLKFGIDAILSRSSSGSACSNSLMPTKNLENSFLAAAVDNITSSSSFPPSLYYADSVPIFPLHNNTTSQLQSSLGVCWPDSLTFTPNNTKTRRAALRRAVFSDSQRKGLEERFQIQKYISKPDRKKLADQLGLKDSQVKIWYQNRRMKWRNTKARETAVQSTSQNNMCNDFLSNSSCYILPHDDTDCPRKEGNEQLEICQKSPSAINLNPADQQQLQHNEFSFEVSSSSDLHQQSTTEE